MATDINKRQIIAISTLSTVLLSRNAFPPNCFQSLPSDAITSNYKKLLTRGSPVLPEAIGSDHSGLIFLRKCNNSALKNLLSLVEKDYLPLIAENSMRKLYLCVFETPEGTASGLHELYEFDFNTQRGDMSSIIITFIGQTDQLNCSPEAIARDPQSLLGFLSELPSFKGPMYHALFACVDIKNQHGMSIAGKTDFDVEATSRVLRERPTSTTCKIAEISLDLGETTKEDITPVVPSTPIREASKKKQKKQKKQPKQPKQPKNAKTPVNSTEEAAKKRVPETPCQTAPSDEAITRHQEPFSLEEICSNGLLDDFFSSPLASPVSSQNSIAYIV